MRFCLCYTHLRPRRGVAQPGSAPALGAGGRRFKSSRPDHRSLNCGCSSMVELQPSKLAMGVRFPSPALRAPVAKGTEQRTSNPRKYVHGCQLRSSKTSYLSGMRLRALLRVCHSLVSTADLLLTRCRLEGNDSGTAIPACPGLFRQSCKVNAANFSCGMFSE